MCRKPRKDERLEALDRCLQLRDPECGFTPCFRGRLPLCALPIAFSSSSMYFKIVRVCIGDEDVSGQHVEAILFDYIYSANLGVDFVLREVLERI